jgi:hypothetical protein
MSGAGDWATEGERPFEELAQNASQQAVALAREQLDVARQELTARAGRAAPGLALVGGGALLGALASGTGTASLILLLARRPGASAAALAVTGGYAGAGALLVREGLERLRDPGSPLPDTAVEDEPVDAKQGLGSAKRRAQSATKSPTRVKTAAKSASAKAPASRRRAAPTQTDRRRRS